MAIASAKNQSLSASALDLGLGDQLKNQTEDEINQRKKKLAQMAISPATLSLFNMGQGGG
jgi:hypothetical protein